MPTLATLQKLRDTPASAPIEDVRRRLRDALQAEVTLKPLYAWAFPEHESTDEAVRTFLDANPPEPTVATGARPIATLEPCLYRTHLAEASAILDRCLARRDQIYALEGAAVTTALDYIFADANHAGELALALLSVKAARRQGNADQNDADEGVVQDQFALRTQARNARLALHAQEGNPLNYGQRINELRRLFADDIRSVYERLHAARLGMHLSGVAPNLPVPRVWSAALRDNLLQLVVWCRAAIRQMELRSVHEVVYKVAFFLKGDGFVKDTDMRAKLAENRDVVFSLTLDDDRFLQNGPHRLLNVGVAVVFGAAGIAEVPPRKSYSAHPIAPMPGSGAPQPTVNVTEPSDEALRQQWELGERKGFAFDTWVNLPPQTCQFDPPGYPGERLYQWNRPPVTLVRETAEWEGLAAQRYSVSSGTQVLNTNPRGRWQITLGPKWHASGGDGTRRELREKNITRWQITDLVLHMTVASLIPGGITWPDESVTS